MRDLINTYPFLTGIISFLIGLACMPVVLRIAKEKHFVVKPNKRMSHTGEIPNIGGIDICVSFLLTYLLFEFNELAESQFLLIGLLMILLVGFADDLLDLSPLTKILGELTSGVALIMAADIRITNLMGFCSIGDIPVWASYLLSFAVLVFLTNALNLIDGIDGLASGLGILYCLFFAIWFEMAGEQSWAVFGYSMTGALAVFFIYNVFGGSKRKIFMGDSGSLLLGFLLTAFVFHFIELNAHDATLSDSISCSAAPIVAVCVIAIPIFDTLRVMVTRIMQKRSPFQADKNHIHHWLLSLGLTHLKTTSVLLAVSIGFIGLGIVARNWNMWLLLAVWFAVCCVLISCLYPFVRKARNAHTVSD